MKRWHVVCECSKLGQPLRWECLGTGNGRVYVVHFTVSDGQSGSCNGSVKVNVPHSKKDTAGEGPQLYNSFAP